MKVGAATLTPAKLGPQKVGEAEQPLEYQQTVATASQERGRLPIVCPVRAQSRLADLGVTEVVSGLILRFTALAGVLTARES